MVVVVALDMARSGEILCSVYTMVIKTELWTRVHSPVVRAADCRSACPWFNSGWRHWIHNHWHVQRNNIMSAITTTITMPMTTIPRKSVNMVAELAPWIPDTTKRQEDYSAVAKDATTTAVALDTKARAAQRTVVQLKNEVAQSQQSRTEAKTQMDSLVDCRHRGGPNTRTTIRIVAGQTQYDPTEPQASYSTGRGSVDHRHHRLGDDGENSR